jgi:hypothetical protein
VSRKAVLYKLEPTRVAKLPQRLYAGSSPRHVFASEYCKRDFVRFQDRLGQANFEFKSLIPRLYLPSFLRNSQGYQTHAFVSLPVLNPKTPLKPRL